MAPTDEAAREVEESRESYREWLSGPESFLAAVARHDPIRVELIITLGRAEIERRAIGAGVNRRDLRFPADVD